MKVRLGNPGRKNRAEHVHIDNFDVWNLDHTLSCIIHPALIRLRETKQGYPQLIEDGMVTPHYWDRQLHFDFIDEKVEEKYLLNKWNDIMDKMIYSFGVIKNDGLFEKYDEEEWNRIQEGLDLFAKHYTSLWD